MLEHINALNTMAQTNKEILLEAAEPEEGVDYKVMPEGFQDPTEPSEKQLEKQIRREIQ